MRECLSAGGDGAGVGFLAGVGAEVDFQVGGLAEGFGAVGVGAEVFADFVGGGDAGGWGGAACGDDDGSWWLDCFHQGVDF